jgi:hypothetical protein
MPWASAEAHARLEACDDGRFVGCQRSDCTAVNYG